MKTAFIGFGEAARAFTDSLSAAGAGPFTAYDIKQESGDKSVAEAAESRGVTLAPDPIAAIEGAEVVISAVTAAVSHEALIPIAPALREGQTVWDINSVSGARKAGSSELIKTSGAGYLDMAVMAPVHPRGHRTPVFVAGDVAAAEPFLDRYTFAWEAVGETPGQATSIKMIRSLFVKGLEALSVQAMLAAREADCFDRVYKSLSTSYEGLGWPTFPAYNCERITRHGIRRAAEMEESSTALREFGFPFGADMAAAIAETQAAIGNLGVELEDKPDLEDAVEQILAALKAKR